jgi:hypothetical protein
MLCLVLHSKPLALLAFVATGVSGVWPASTSEPKARASWSVEAFRPVFLSGNEPAPDRVAQQQPAQPTGERPTSRPRPPPKPQPPMHPPVKWG